MNREKIIKGVEAPKAVRNKGIRWEELEVGESYPVGPKQRGYAGLARKRCLRLGLDRQFVSTLHGGKTVILRTQ
jgi:hypothetical protein